MIRTSKPGAVGRMALACAMAFATLAISSQLFAHGNVTPQPVDTSALPDIAPDNDTWVTHNPYRGNAKAIEIGESAYGQNCARCHGLGAISGGIAPDLRLLELGDMIRVELTFVSNSQADGSVQADLLAVDYRAPEAPDVGGELVDSGRRAPMGCRAVAQHSTGRTRPGHLEGPGLDPAGRAFDQRRRARGRAARERGHRFAEAAPPAAASSFLKATR